MKSSEFSFHFMPGLIIMCASRLNLQTFLLYIFPLLFSNNPTFSTNEHDQVPLLKQGYWNPHLLFSVAENKTKVPAFKPNWMLLLLHQVTPSRSIRKLAPHRAIPTPIPAPVQLCSTTGTTPCWKKNSARSRCERRYNNRDMSIYTQVVTPGWTGALQCELNCVLRQTAAVFLKHLWHTAAFYCA